VKEFALTGYDDGVATTVASLTGNLAELIGAMVTSGEAIDAIAEFSDHRYVQFAIWPERGVIGEVISNLNIGDEVALTMHEEERLRQLGFHEPVPGPNPNWWFEATDPSGLVRLMKMMNSAIFGVLRERPENLVNVRTFHFVVPGDMSQDRFREVTRIYYGQRQHHRPDESG